MIKLGIFGNPVEHSKSPLMQNSALQSLGIDGFYDKYLLLDGSQIKNEFLSLRLDGANITVPHKEDAYKNADEIRGIAQKIGAVNTYVKENDKVIAYNTDGLGFMMAIEEFGNIQNAIILGAGGTAKAIAVALKDANIEVTIINRSRKGRLEFFEELGCKCYTPEELSSLSTINYQLSTIIINTTSAGLKDDLLPMQKELLQSLMKNASFAFDCIYGKTTPFLALAKEMGLQYKDGKDMLLFQGVLALELFIKQPIPTSTIEQMDKCLK
ncbi:shikimate dehydrogenase [Arcobacter sp. FWKO B]|uniref:shikimate dehydrogenase n=1 Tax=Arcobacter sp. FWKO B TaxID=2593672 RepID=UPI0018A64449|nr:shikimate dehydrogenase [Arcobacter sp. FWKO B]QOG11574.1 shikimate dehydrogenase [Arcobacter sp. FWKO B]